MSCSQLTNEQVKFPRDRFSVDITELDPKDLPEALAKLKKFRTRLEINIEADAEVKVEGYGMPFRNPLHPADSWINDDAPIVDELTLLALLQQRKFVLLVKQQPLELKKRLDIPMSHSPPLEYPYDPCLEWSWEKAKQTIPPNEVCNYQKK